MNCKDNLQLDPRMKRIKLEKTERDAMEMALSTDIVMDVVVKHLKVRDLLSCRLVSKGWNTAASSVLRRGSTMMKTISEENHLMELQECMKKSSDFPFTGLKLDKPWSLNSDNAMNFFKIYGDRITRLCLDTIWCVGLRVLAPFIRHLPCLLILEVGKCHSQSCLPPANLRDSAARQEDDCLHLASLQILRFNHRHCTKDTDILLEVFAAASPLLQIECLNTSEFIISHLESAGKLGAVSVMKIAEDYESFQYETEPFLSTESPSLTKLDFTVSHSLTLDVLEKVLLSSQHTLKELRLESLDRWALNDTTWETLWSKSPVFPKLTMLNVRVNSPCNYLFRGAHGPKFPALKELKLEMKNDRSYLIDNLSDSLFIVPSVTRIDLDGYISGYGLEQLAQAFPNVVEISLQYERYNREGGRTDWRSPIEIWCVREFKFLEKLRIWNCTVKRPSEYYINMDSFLTGIPFGICENVLQQEQLALHLINSPLKQAFGQVLRDNANILELQNLKELIVCVKLGYEHEQLPKETPFMTMLSFWYALEMIPNLRTKFVYEEPSSPSLYEGRYQEVLEAEFQHVQPYVKLERFFY